MTHLLTSRGNSRGGLGAEVAFFLHLGGVFAGLVVDIKKGTCFRVEIFHQYRCIFGGFQTKTPIIFSL